MPPGLFSYSNFFWFIYELELEKVRIFDRCIDMISMKLPHLIRIPFSEMQGILCSHCSRTELEFSLWPSWKDNVARSEQDTKNTGCSRMRLCVHVCACERVSAAASVHKWRGQFGDFVFLISFLACLALGAGQQQQQQEQLQLHNGIANCFQLLAPASGQSRLADGWPDGWTDGE